MESKISVSVLFLFVFFTAPNAEAGCIGPDGQWLDISSCASRPCSNGKTRDADTGACVCLAPKRMIGSQCTPPPTNSPGSGGTTGTQTAPDSQPLALLGSTLLNCPAGAADCGNCPSDTGNSDSASCGPSAFSNFMVESLSRQAGSSNVSDANISAAKTLASDDAGIQ